MKVALSGKNGEGKYALIDEEDYELIKGYKWFVGSHGYAQVCYQEDGKTVSTLMHRLILQVEKGKMVDHINMEKLDNRRTNLRAATKSENIRNSGKRSSNTSGFKGVVLHRGQRWKAEITKDYKKMHLGLFTTAEEAARAYDAKAFELFGEFAKFNFPGEPIVSPVKGFRNVDNTSGYRGVTLNKRSGNWSATVQKDKVTFRLGTFTNIEDAARAYNGKAYELFGDKAILNVISSEVAI